MKLLFRTLLVAALLAAPSHAASVVADPFPPARFSSLYIEKDDFGGTSTIITLSGDSVIYKVSQGGKVIDSATTHPSGDDWFKFIQGLNAAKVYNWAHTYYYPGQGGTWVIDFAMDERPFTSRGTNEFPLAGDESKPQANPASGPSVPFQLFWQAALALAGKAPPAQP